MNLVDRLLIRENEAKLKETAEKAFVKKLEESLFELRPVDGSRPPNPSEGTMWMDAANELYVYTNRAWVKVHQVPIPRTPMPADWAGVNYPYQREYQMDYAIDTLPPISGRLTVPEQTGLATVLSDVGYDPRQAVTSDRYIQ